MADIAKAYVQIIPSAEGIQGNLTSMLSGEAGKAGTKAGTAFSSGMGKAMTAAKLGATAAVATGAAVAATTSALVKGTASVASYGDNIDKMSQKMGISAEAYQEWDAIMQHSGTSIEALKPSMKTLATQAEKGNEAFQKLGISEEEVANISQEDLFSKVITGLQNMEEGTERTYLTSQLLGRGATELGALLNTSAEDTEKMRQKVHELGGVLSDEAVKAAAKFQDTLQDMGTGFDSLKRNMLSEFLPSITTVMEGMTAIFTGDKELGLEQLSQGITDFVGNLTSVIPDFLEVGANILMSLAEGIVKNLPQLATAVIDILGKIGNMIIENLPLLLQTGIEIIATLAQSIAEALPTLIPTIVSVILQMVETLIDNIDLLVDAGIQLLIGLAEGLINALPVLLEKAPVIIQKLVDAIVENIDMIIEATVTLIQVMSDALVQNLPVLIEAGIQLTVAIMKGIIKATPQLLASSGKLVQGIVETFTQINWLELGLQIIRGIISGITSGTGELFASLKNLAGNALRSAKEAFKIHSPSALFRDDVGGMISLGIAEGINDYTSPILDAMGGLSDMSIGKFNAANQIKDS